MASVAIGGPPFAANPHRLPASVFYGQVRQLNLNSTTAAVTIITELPVAVAVKEGPRQIISLPRYGRVQLTPGFVFPNSQGAFDIGVPGNWHRPNRFAVQVDAGANPPGQRTDIATPDLTDPTALHWESNDRVQAVVQRTDLQLESRQQTIVFLLGAVVGAAAAVLLTVLETLAGSVQLRAKRRGST